jgi:hypothetical protein
MRKCLIATGVPLAVACLGWSVWFGGLYAILGAMGMYTAMRVVDMICEPQ